jgi:hypothetical protein
MYYPNSKFIISLLFILILPCFIYGENPCLKEVADLPPFEGIPNPFQFCNGEQVKSIQDWQKRREEIRVMLVFYEYGHLPPPPKIRI